MRPTPRFFLLPLTLLAGSACDAEIDGELERADADAALALDPRIADSGHSDDASDDRPGPAPTGAAELTAPVHAVPDGIPPPYFCSPHPTPTSEHAWKISQKGFLDTNVDFASFFNGPHTIMGWVMPEFTFNSYGPIFAESGGGGLYMVGQGDYRNGNGGNQVAGDPVLHVSVGGKSVNYLAPGYKKREWNHVALVRTAADASGIFKFKLYVNGSLLTPMSGSEIWFGPASPLPAAQVPQGNLRLGRRTSGLDVDSSKSWQFYGLVDEVAVFNSALTSWDVGFYEKCGFGGSEAAMVAGLTFDTYSAGVPAGPKIEAPVTPVAPVSNFTKRLAVATGNKPANVADAQWFDHWLYVAPTQVSYQLPFPVGEEWRVNFGPDDHDGSHNGYAAFCWDFGRVSMPAQATVTAVASGEIFGVLDTNVAAPGTRESNFIQLKTAVNENVVYLHQHGGTFEEVFLGGDPLTFLPQAGPAFWLDVTQGEPLAKVGQQAQHLHFDGNDGLLTTPLAFSTYEVKDTSVNPPVWNVVLRGIPKQGQIIRRM